MGSTEEEVAELLEEARAARSGRLEISRLPHELPKHRVRITSAFYLGMTEVTQAEYERVVGDNPSHFKGNPTYPVEMVDWHDAMAFCEKLGGLPEEQVAEAQYRLPTEAEWEYACRAGTTTRWYWADDEVTLEEHAWFNANAGGTTQPVGAKKPNAWGLHDMFGNVWEWCADWYDPDYYAISPLDDPMGPGSGSSRVGRSGSWSHGEGPCRSANRGGSRPGSRTRRCGFRVARSALLPSN